MRNKIKSKDFRVPPGEKVNFMKWPTLVKPICKSKKHYKKLLEEQVEELSSQHVAPIGNRLYRRLPTCGTADCQSALHQTSGSWRGLDGNHRPWREQSNG